MKQLLIFVPLILLGFLGVGIALTLARRKIERGRKRVRPPLDHPLLRPPGHTLAERLGDHQDKFFDPALALFLGTGFLSAGGGLLVLVAMLKELRDVVSTKGFVGLFAVPGFLQLVGWFVFLSITGVLSIWWGWRCLMEWFRENHRLRYGLRGEQAVAEELQHAVRRGYHVFHDLPTDKECNIDHVVVGPAGVFAIETKARSKGVTTDREPPDNKVDFDGTQLKFTNGRVDSKTVRQIEAITRWLEDALSRPLGMPVKVKGVIALPGWYVERRDFPKVIARNPEYFAKELGDAERRLSDQNIELIADHLDKLSRDVKF